MAERCEQCLTEGITLLPMRWGCSIDINELGIANLSYPQRLLHEGYVYILDNNNKWYGYIITEGRYFKGFTVTGVSGPPPYANEPDLPYKDSTCLKGGNCTVLNSFIRIPNPNNDIETLWIAYSPVKWTKTVLDRHKNNTDGAKTNNMIELSQALKNNSRLYEAGQASTWGYASDGGSNSQALFGNLPIEYGPIGPFQIREKFIKPNPFTNEGYLPNKQKEAIELNNALISYMRKDIDTTGEDNTVFVVTFSDSVGTLIDLNELMINIEDYYDSKLLKSMSVNSFDTLNHKAFIANTILDLENQIKSNAPAYADKRKRESLSDPYGSNHIFLTSKEDLAKGYYKNNWEEGFKEFIRYDEMKKWSSSYDKAKNTNNISRKEILDELVEAYNEELLSEYLKAEMTYNFDSGDIDSCASYTLTVQEFIGSTAKYSIIAEQYTAMLTKNSLSNKKNYLGRAYCFNDDSTINQVENQSKGLTINGILTLSWSAAAGEVLSVIKNKYLTKLKDYGTTITLEQLTFDTYLYARKIGNDKLVTSTAYPNIKLGRSDLLMSIFTRRPLSVVTVEGNIKEIAKGVYGLLKTELSKNGGQQISNNKLRDAASQFVNEMEADGIEVNKNITTKVTVFVSIEALTNANSAKSSADIAKAMMTDYRLKFEEFKVFYKSQASQSGAGNFGGVLQVLSCLSLFGGFIDSAGTDAKEPLHKFGASIAILAGGVVQHRADVVGLRRELYGAVPTNSPHRQVKLARMVEGTELAYSGLKVGARSLNIGGAAVFAYYDYQAAMTNFENNDNAMGVLYLTSAGSGVISTTLLAFGVSGSWVPVAGWVILGVSIVAGLAIMWFERTPLEKWLQYGTWGTDNKSWTFETEKLKLEKAANGEAIKI